MLKIYTRTGDQGSTALYAGPRVQKNHQRVEAYGTIDEANASLGLAAAACGNQHPRLRAILARLQQEMFDAGADLADPEAKPDGTGRRQPRITARHVEQLEADIDGLQSQLAPLRQFIMPGGGETAARLHFSRTVVRRAERRVITAAEQSSLNDEVIRYLNRLSDLLFVMARFANQTEGVADITWQPGGLSGEQEA